MTRPTRLTSYAPRARRGARLAGAALAIAALVPLSQAHAATLGPAPSGEGSGQVLRYSAAPGETNALGMTLFAPDTFQLQDTGTSGAAKVAVTAQPPCRVSSFNPFEGVEVFQCPLS